MDSSWVAAKDCNFQMKESRLILMILIKKGAIWLKILTKSCQIVDNKIKLLLYNNLHHKYLFVLFFLAPARLILKAALTESHDFFN